MKVWAVVFWGAVGVLVAVSLAMSCADSRQAPCDPDECYDRCIAAYGTGGECVGNECYCYEDPTPEAGTDLPEVHDRPDVRPDVQPDVRPDVDVAEVRDDAARPEDVGREEFTRDDADARRDDAAPSGDAEAGTPDGGGETKSGCDPLICFMSCGGYCSIDGECICAET